MERWLAYGRSFEPASGLVGLGLGGGGLALIIMVMEYVPKCGL